MEYIYKLTLEERLLQSDNWTDQDEIYADDHFAYLQDLLSKNILLLAGKTEGLDQNTYGIVIFKANSLDEATIICKNDPGVKSGIMNAELNKYNLALLNEEYNK